MKYLLKRTYDTDINQYKEKLSDFNVSYIDTTKDDENYTLCIIDIKSLEELNQLNDKVGKIVIKEIDDYEIDDIDYELDKDITKVIEIYDDYRE